MYSPNFVKFYIIFLKRVARSIDDLECKDFINFAVYSFDKDVFMPAKAIMLLLCLLKIRWYHFLFKFRINRLNSNQIEELSEYAEKYTDISKLTSDKCFIPFLRIRGKKYYGPNMKFTNITFGEFTSASDYLTLFNEHNKDEYLDKFLAVLYKPKNESIDQVEIIRRSAVMARLPIQTKMAVYFNWLLMMNFLSSLFQSLFVKSDKKSNIYWIDVVSEWVGHIPENYNVKFDLPLTQVLFSLNKLNQEQHKKAVDKILNKN